MQRLHPVGHDEWGVPIDDVLLERMNVGPGAEYEIEVLDEDRLLIRFIRGRDSNEAPVEPATTDDAGASGKPSNE